MTSTKHLKIETGKTNDVLRTVSLPIKNLTTKTPRLDLSLNDFVKEMKLNLATEKGLGIAAPQVGENLRIALVRIDNSTPKEILFVMVNPEITWKSWDGEVKVMTGKKLDVIAVPDGAAVDEEGCLSLPGFYANVMRANEISVKFFDGRSLLKGKSKTSLAKDLPLIILDLKGMNARVVQHEVDHLDGILICDKVQ